MGVFGESKKERMLRLYDTHARTVWRICRLYLSDTEAEDAVHDVFLKLLTRDVTLRGAEHEKAWLIRTARNLCCDRLRAGSRRELSLEETAERASNDAPRDLLAMVRALPEPLGTVVYLRYYEGYTAAEIGRVMECSEATVYRWLQKAREQLREQWEETV